MPPILASFLWFTLLVGLLLFDPAKNSKTSLALWVPLIWMFIIGSRLPSQWLGGGVETVSQALEEGNLLDRSVFACLILLSLGILMSRSFNWGRFFARNVFLTAFLLFALTSVLWSDFPFISFKRWFRDLGNYLVVLVILSDSQPFEAVRTLFRRLGYLLIPLSVLIIKYYPQIGKQYDNWTGASMYVGATTGKNMLGVVCLVSGVFFFWDTITRWARRKERRTKLIIVLNVMFLGMILWLLNLANSATSRVCLVLGCLVIAAAHIRTVKRNPIIVKVLIPICLCLYMVLQFGFGINGQLAGMLGRDATLTGRTDLWKVLLNLHTNPLLGTGYESLWLGPRLEWIWRNFNYGINESHNGYLEIYLNLGLIGLFLLCGFLIANYLMICKRLTPDPGFASFMLSLWTILLFYNVTEAAFKVHPMWLGYLMGVIAIPDRAENRVSGWAAIENRGATTPISAAPVEPAGLLR